MKEKLKKIFENGRWVLIFLFILEVILVMFVTPNTYDDAWFISQISSELDPATNQLIEHSIMDFVKDRYQTWTSRVIVEFVLCLNLRISKYLWILLEAVMVTIVRIFNIKVIL